MYDTLKNVLFQKDNAVPASASFSFLNATPASEDETVIFLTSRSVYRTLEAGVDGDGVAGDEQIPDLLQAYLDRGGVIWICNACQKAGNWQARPVQTKPEAAPTSAIFGAEYIMQDIVRYFLSRPQVDAQTAKVAGSDMAASIIDPKGHEIGSIDKRVGKNTITTRHHNDPLPKSHPRGGRRTVSNKPRFIFGWAHGLVANRRASDAQEVING